MVQRIHIEIYRSSNLSNFIKLLSLGMIIAKFKTLFIIFFFRMFPFPTKKKKEEERQKWKQLVNCQNRKGKLRSPSKDMRVCSKHFIDGNQHLTTHIHLSTLVTIAEEEYRTLHPVQKEESFITLKIQYLLKRIIKLPLIAVVITQFQCQHTPLT